MYLSTNGDLVKDFSDHGSNIHDYVELANDPKSDFSKENNTNLISSFFMHYLMTLYKTINKSRFEKFSGLHYLLILLHTFHKNFHTIL